MRVGEKIELVLKIKVQETCDCGVWSYNARMQAGVLGKSPEFLPMFVAAARRGGYRNWEARLGSAFEFWMEHGIRKLLCRECREVLAVAVFKNEIEADTLKADLDAFVRIIAKIDLDCEHASTVGGLFGEC